METVKLNTIEEAIEDFKAGNFVIVVDDEDRENEGDLIIAAEKITPEKVNFMLKHARGVLCAPITVSRCKELDLPHQVMDNTSVLGTPFTVHPCACRPGFHTCYFRASGACQSALCPRERRAAPRRAYRGNH